MQRDEARTSYRYDAEGLVATITRPCHQGTDLARQMHWDEYGRLWPA